MESIETIKDKIIPVLKRHNVLKAAIFGSIFIKDVLEAICKIEEYTALLVQDAVLRRLGVIGEAVKNIPSYIF